MAHRAAEGLRRRGAGFPRLRARWSGRPRRALIFFGRAPEPGRVKTRLIPPLDPAAAARLYAALLQDLAFLLLRVRAEVRLAAYDPAAPAGRLLPHLPRAFDLIPQEGMDLGQRMERALEGAFRRGAGVAVLVGSDCPSLRPQVVEEALRALEEGGKEAVLGPSHDGGYYLVGARRPVPALFEGQRWSHPGVYRESVRRARAAGIRLGEVAPGFDLDRWEDLLLLSRLLRRAEWREALPRTVSLMAAGVGRGLPWSLRGG
ncbi:MAG: TIGR04282 family arsenosugar biosynthesis glycosyltransferase [Nitrospinota bacterium]